MPFPITDRRAADALRGDGAEHLRHFVFGENTVSAAAAAGQVPLHRMYYWVRTLCDVGLLEVTREQRRGGRAVKWYRAVADSFEVPTSLLPESRLAKNLRAETEVVIRGFEKALGAEVEDMPLQVDFTLVNGEPVAGRSYTTPRLRASGRPQPFTWFTAGRRYTPEVAVELVEALRSVVDDFEARQAAPGDPDAQHWRLGVSMVPDPDA